jgi:hypothetical protein
MSFLSMTFLPQNLHGHLQGSPSRVTFWQVTIANSWLLHTQMRTSCCRQRSQLKSKQKISTMHFFLESLVLVLVLMFAPSARGSGYSLTCDNVTNPATCYGVCELKKDECHCVRENSNKKCPKKPKTGYEQDIIDALRSQQALNPITLVDGCNPFFNSTCQTFPPLVDVSQKESKKGKKGKKGKMGKKGSSKGKKHTAKGNKRNVPVCGIKYEVESQLDGECPAFYSLQTYENLVEASRDGAVVTHVGGEYLLRARLMLQSPASLTFSFRFFITYQLVVSVARRKTLQL